MAPTWRLFIALKLPQGVVDMLTEVQEQLKHAAPARAVRWVQPEGIHLTLKFLGDAPVTQRAALEKALLKAVQGHAPFTLTTTTLGCFPNTNRPRVAWVGLGGAQTKLNALRDAVEQHIAPLGYPTENRPFNPHLTLGRIRREARPEQVKQIGTLIDQHPAPSTHTWTVRDVILYRSELKPTGAIYTALYRANLKADTEG